MVQADQMVTIWRFAQRTLQQRQLLIIEIARHGPRNREESSSVTRQLPRSITGLSRSITDATGGLHGGHFIMVTRETSAPARMAAVMSRKRCQDSTLPSCEVAATGQHQVDPRLSLQHAFNHPLQSVLGIHTQPSLPAASANR